MDCSTPGFPVHYQLPEFAQTHVHWVGDAIQPSYSLSSLLLLSSLSAYLLQFYYSNSLKEMPKKQQKAFFKLLAYDIGFKM